VKVVWAMFPESGSLRNSDRLILDGFVKSPDAALRESLVIPTYVKVRLIPHDSRALPAALFTKPSYLASLLTFYDFIILKRRGYENA
jgi:hypothetical protein